MSAPLQDPLLLLAAGTDLPEPDPRVVDRVASASRREFVEKRLTTAPGVALHSRQRLKPAYLRWALPIGGLIAAGIVAIIVLPLMIPHENSSSDTLITAEDTRGQPETGPQFPSPALVIAMWSDDAADATRFGAQQSHGTLAAPDLVPVELEQLEQIAFGDLRLAYRFFGLAVDFYYVDGEQPVRLGRITASAGDEIALFDAFGVRGSDEVAVAILMETRPAGSPDNPRWQVYSSRNHQFVLDASLSQLLSPTTDRAAAIAQVQAAIATPGATLEDEGGSGDGDG